MNPLQTGPTVLVGVDGSDYALRAVRWAAVEANRRQLPLRLVHAFAWVIKPDFTTPTGGDHYRNMLIEQAREHLDSAVATAAQVRPGLTVQQQLIVGHPAEVLTAEARRAALLVLGDRGLNRIEGVLVGSTAAAMAVHSACPLIVVRGVELTDKSSRMRPVVVGVDDAPNSDAAIGFAFDAAATRDVPLIAVHAYSHPVADPAFGKLIDWAVVVVRGGSIGRRGDAWSRPARRAPARIGQQRVDAQGRLPGRGGPARRQSALSSTRVAGGARQ